MNLHELYIILFCYLIYTVGRQYFEVKILHPPETLYTLNSLSCPVITVMLNSHL